MRAGATPVDLARKFMSAHGLPSEDGLEAKLVNAIVARAKEEGLVD